MDDTSKQGHIGLGTLKTIFESKEYIKELEDLSCYGAHIKQERPMLYLLAKYLYKKGFVNMALEKKLGENLRYDLVLNNTKIEAKFYYESDLRNRLEKEMNKFSWNIDFLKEKLDSLKKEGTSYSWNMMPSIIKDIFNKNPDIFILIILSRDLRKRVAELPLEQICWGKDEIRYNEDHGFNDKNTFGLLDKFFSALKRKKNFVSDYLKIDIDKVFPSSYHIYFCDFRP